MEYSVVLSDQAKEDIAEIYSYILNVLKSEINAESVLHRLYSAMNEVRNMAESYHLYQMSLGIRKECVIFLLEIIPFFML